MIVPQTQYAKVGSVHIAYQVVGSGPPDLVMVPGFVSHIECNWEEPSFARALERLAGFSRLILFDKRGTGLSDRVSDMPTLEQRMDDVRAVMDAAGSARAAILGVSEGGAMSTVFAATHPDRTSLLLLYGAFAAFRSWYPTPEELDAFFNYCETRWGTGGSIGRYAPSLAEDERFRHWWARYERQGASPGAAMTLMQMNADIDIEDILPTVHVPTLVIHRRDDTAVNPSAGRYLADHIPGATLAELPGFDHLLWVGDTDAVIDRIEEFVTGTRATAPTDRVLATVVFIDMVDSTRRAAEMGDLRWGDLLKAYQKNVRQEISRFHGVEIDTAGDGFFATFDGPARAIRCARAVRESVEQLGIGVRAGLHTGECERIGKKIGGLAVHIGARVAAEAQAGQVLVSSTVKDLVAGSRLRFSEHKKTRLKGVPGRWRLYAVSESTGANR
jgi:pimeloyl-ACP methyl ester carboxylesterase